MLEKVHKYAVGIWGVRGSADRFCPGGYTDHLSTEEAIRRVAELPQLKAIEFQSTDFEGSAASTKRLLDDLNLEACGVLANTFTRQWMLGSLSHTDDRLRAAAVEEVSRAVSLADELDCRNVTLWLGSDGFDYSFQVDYERQWDVLVKSLDDLTSAHPETRFALEYKPKEPRKRLFLDSAMKALWCANRVGRDNIGVLVDFGHALMAGETPAEAALILQQEKKLFGIHFNDAYRAWDDDLVAGSVNVWETLEFIYYLDRIGYDGWLSFDIFPFRMDGVRAVELCIRSTENLIRLAEKIDPERLAQAQGGLRAEGSLELLQELLE